jgi:hypothetical protein
MFKHDAGNVSCSVPDVVVLSEYVPPDFAVHVPVTWRDPVTDAEQFRPIPDRSSEPDTFRHDDVAFQVPTTLPPQAITLEHDAGAPPLEPDELPELAPDDPPELEPLLGPGDPELASEPLSADHPEPLFENDPQARVKTVNAAAMAIRLLMIVSGFFIGELPEDSAPRSRSGRGRLDPSSPVECRLVSSGRPSNAAGSNRTVVVFRQWRRDVFSLRVSNARPAVRLGAEERTIPR